MAKEKITISGLKEMIERAIRNEGGWVTVRNDAGEPMGKEYVYDSSDPEYYEGDDDEYGGGGHSSSKGRYTGEKSNEINWLRDTLKSNDIYSKIGMGSKGRYVWIPYGDDGISVTFPFDKEGMKVSVGRNQFSSAFDAASYVVSNYDKSKFKSQSEHEAGLKSASKERKATAKVRKAEKEEADRKNAEREKIMSIPGIKDAIARFTLKDARNYKVIFGNIPSKKISGTIQDIIDTLPAEELKQIKKIEVDVPKMYENSKSLEEVGVLTALGAAGIALVAKKAYDKYKNYGLRKGMKPVLGDDGKEVVKKGANGVVARQYTYDKDGKTYWGVTYEDRTRDQGFENPRILLFRPERIDKVLNADLKWDTSDEARQTDGYEKSLGQFYADKVVMLEIKKNNLNNKNQKTMATKKIKINELRALIESVLNEGLPMGESKPAQDAANTLNSMIGKMSRPDLQQKARELAGQLISLIDKDQKEG